MNSVRTPLDRSAAVIGLVTVVAANFLYLAGLPLILDPMISMDAFYIELAGRPFATIVSQDPGWGVLYALWLKPFVAVLGDPVTVYLANLYAISIGVSVLIYLHLLLLTGRAAVGVAAALFFVISDFNVPLANKASGFALMMILGGLTVSELLPSRSRRLTVATAGVLLASYVRPELYPAALCLWAAAFWMAYRESGRLDWRAVGWPATCAAFALILAVSIGTPIFSPYHDSDRLLVAFREHFAWNWNRWHNDWQHLFASWEQEFGGADTMLQAVATNPGAVIHHLADNLIGTARFMITSAFDHYPLLAPATNPGLVKAENLVVSIAVIGALAFVVASARWRRRLIDSYGYALFEYATVAMFSIAAAAMIFPVPHYLAVPSAMLMLAGALAVALIVRTEGVPLSRQVLAALICLAAVPRPFVLPSAYVVPGSPFKAHIGVSRVITDTIGFVHGLGLPTPVYVLTAADGFGAMLGPGFHEVRLWQKGAQPLQDYMRDSDVGLVVNLDAGRESFAVDDPYWQRVQTNPETTGFTRLVVPGHEAIGIYLRNDLNAARTSNRDVVDKVDQ